MLRNKIKDTLSNVIFLINNFEWLDFERGSTVAEWMVGATHYILKGVLKISSLALSVLTTDLDLG